MRKAIAIRLSVSLLVGILAAGIISEVSFRTQDNLSRSPQIVELVIPSGTSELVRRGEQPPAIPEAMIFVAGDMLLVRNEDVVDHQLGPLWIPVGSEASLVLDQVGTYADQCSFQPTRYFNLDVREPLTLWTRLQGILLAGLPLGILLALYAMVAWPLKK